MIVQASQVILNYVDLEEQFSVDIGCKKGILYLLATTRIASANSSNQASEPNHKASGSHEKLLIFFFLKPFFSCKFLLICDKNVQVAFASIAIVGKAKIATSLVKPLRSLMWSASDCSSQSWIK